MKNMVLSLLPEAPSNCKCPLSLHPFFLGPLITPFNPIPSLRTLARLGLSLTIKLLGVVVRLATIKKKGGIVHGGCES
jgi:hypothetical protein